jgi:hypothetical protein
MAAVLSDHDVSRDSALAARLACDGQVVSIGRHSKVPQAIDWPATPPTSGTKSSPDCAIS